MCSQCKNVFLFKMIEAESSEEALAKFIKEESKFYILYANAELVEEKAEDFSGYYFSEEYYETLEQGFWSSFTYKERSIDKIYIYQSEILNQKGLMIVTCIVDRKPMYCMRF